MAATRWSTRLGLWLLTGVVAGCTMPPPPDPNDSSQTPRAYVQPIKRLSDSLNEKIGKGSMTDAQAKQMISSYAGRVLAHVDITKVKPEEAWEYGDLFRTARRWKDAKALLQTAVKVADVDDRRVNDSLRLAHVLAELSEVGAAIEVARSTFKVPRAGAAPILPAVLLEIVPAGEGKGSDIELAQLLEDAIHQHIRTVVNRRSKAGRDFEMARWHHIGNAWQKILDLYRKANRKDLVKAAEERAAKMIQDYRLG